ncbi:MAG: calcium-binding protein [Thermodesulfobacteriota bacterium]
MRKALCYDNNACWTESYNPWLDRKFETSRDNFTTIAATPVSPIILDLDGDGVETSHVKDGAYFDQDGNGFAEQTGWAGADDGLLVMDRDGNGTIDTGKELFGNETLLNDGTTAANGFQALADLDDNLDGKIDAGDAAWTSLKIWQDVDGDGLSAAAEFHTLDELGIQSINTGYVDSTLIDAQGNEHQQVGSFIRTDGTTGTATDVWFQSDKAYTIATEWLDVPPEIAALPDLQGYGNVYDLQQAMVRDTSGQLKALVEQFMAATDTSARNSLMEQILFKWTGSDGIDPNSRDVYVDARELAVLEKFFGEQFVGADGSTNPSYNVGPLLSAPYEGIFEMFYAQLMAQTHLKNLYDMVTYTWDEATENVKGDLTVVAAEIQNRLTLDPEAGKESLSEFVRTLRGFDAEDTMNFMTFRSVFAQQSAGLAWIIDTAGKHLIAGTVASDVLRGITGEDAILGGEGNDILYGIDGNDTLSGDAGDDQLYGDSGNNILYGGDGTDTLYGGAGDDILEGGAGNDTIYGEGGSDTYWFGPGSGQDIISDYDATNIDVNTVEFGAGITVADLELVKTSTTLKINIQGTTDSLTLTNWFTSDAYRIEQFKFADGTTLTPADLDAIGYKVYGTINTESLYGSSVGDTMYGYEGNDVLYGYAGNDTLYGGDGADTLYGGTENDVLDGGTGNDYLSGEASNDIYRFGLGSGQDTIYDYDATNIDVNTVEFGAGITVADLELVKTSTNLKVNIQGTTDSLTLTGWFGGDAYKIEQFKFADGTTLTPADLDAIGYKVYGTVNIDYLYGSSAGDTIYGYEGNDSLRGYEGNDTLYGGDGADTLYGGTGNDILEGGAGNDTLYGDGGNDTYRFGLGSGQDIISDYDATNIDVNTVEFGAGITVADLELVKTSATLKINIQGTTDSLTLTNWFTSDAYKIEQFKFADGTTLTPADLDAMGYKVYGTINTESLYGSSVGDTIYGYEGNDVLYGYAGNDTLYGGDGTDSLFGSTGNDVLDGGAGNDSLSGEAGNDIYRFGLGSGQDIISEYDATPGNTDTVQFDLNPLDLIFAQSGYNLNVTVNGTTDQIAIQNWSLSTNYQTEVFQTADGSALLNSQVGQLIQAMATFSADTGISWSQAIQDRPQDVQQILAQYWTPPQP